MENVIKGFNRTNISIESLGKSLQIINYGLYTFVRFKCDFIS